MPNSRTYSIVVNGIDKSIDAVDSLLKKLNELEQRINTLSGKTVSVGASASGSKGGGTAELTAQERIQKKIESTVHRIEESRLKDYQTLQQAKADLKEIEKAQKSVAAAQRISGDEAKQYANTLNGQRQKLADMKLALGDKELGSADFEKQVKDINELNTKILNIEKSFGQYGRNVGRYADGVAEGLQKIKVTVNGATREFSSLREGIRTLKNEMAGMDKGTQEFKNMQEAAAQLESQWHDLMVSSKWMDNLLDTMQSLTAIGSIGNGISALFGFDDSEIQRSIQKLVALQNVMQGVETIRKQMMTREGIGQWLAQGNEMIDNFSKSLFGIKTSATEAAVGLEATAVAEKGVASAGVAATVASKALSASLKALGIGLAIAAASLVISKIWDWVESMNDATEAQKRLNEEENKAKASYYTAKAELSTYAEITKNFNGTKKEEQAIVKQLNSKYGAVLGTYKTVAQWKDVLTQKTEAYCNMMLMEAKLAAQAKRLEEAYLAEMDAQKAEKPWYNLLETEESYRIYQTNIAKQNREAAEKEYKDGLKEMEAYAKEHHLNDFAPQVEDGAKKTGAAITKAEDELTRLRLRLMNDGLRKTLAQLDDARRKEIEQIKSTGAKRAEAMKLIEEYYREERMKAEQQDFEERMKVAREYTTRLLQNDKKLLDERLKNLETLAQRRREAFFYNDNSFDRDKLFENDKDNPRYFQHQSHPNRLKDYAIQYDFIYTGEDRVEYIANKLRENAQDAAVKVKESIDAVYDSAEKAGDGYKRQAREIVRYIDDIVNEYLKKADEIRSSSSGKSEAANEEIASIATQATEAIEQKLADSGVQYSFGLSNYIELAYSNLADAYNDRIRELRFEFYKTLEQEEIKSLNKLSAARKETIEKNAELEKETMDKEYNELFSSLNPYVVQDRIDNLVASGMSVSGATEQAKKFAGIYGGTMGKDFAAGKITLDDYIKYYDDFTSQMLENNKQIKESTKQALLDVDLEKAEQRTKIITDTYSRRIDDIEKAYSASQTKHSNLPVTDSMGIVNVSATHKQVEAAIKEYEWMEQELNKLYNEMRNSLNAGTIDVESFDAQSEKVVASLRKVKDAKDKLIGDKKNVLGEYLKSLMPYMQEVINGLSGILGELSNLYSAQSENRLKILQDENNKLQELYDKQEAIEERHRDNLNTIEDEISNARGARREFLVDQYNAEIDAQRRAVAEKKRLDEELKKNQKKQEDEEKELRKKQNKIQFAQATASAAMAVINAFATQPWAVGQILGPIAAALTGAQLAIMRKAMKESEKYESGGLLVGKSHKQGGIKVLGGQAEVEGGEYIINKRTTSLNEPVIEFINSKKQRLELGDFIDFYSSKSAKKQIKSNLKHKFAEGGALPAANIGRRRSLSEQLINLHPIVAVTDIINETEAYNRVRVLAGDAE